ncbi:hypothetical protein JCGZ_19382 [Jatropha curcas]|uniref:Uncharacterized protein n=1 Tax=Jatropha curcas TaxID=180498 RepID=A0A067K030_JATCU|nr:hypothetical protein JCGZ_19382 [Jatropha curcas]
MVRACRSLSSKDGSAWAMLRGTSREESVARACHIARLGRHDGMQHGPCSGKHTFGLMSSCGMGVPSSTASAC